MQSQTQHIGGGGCHCLPLCMDSGHLRLIPPHSLRCCFTTEQIFRQGLSVVLTINGCSSQTGMMHTVPMEPQLSGPAEPKWGLKSASVPEHNLPFSSGICDLTPLSHGAPYASLRSEELESARRQRAMTGPIKMLSIHQFNRHRSGNEYGKVRRDAHQTNLNRGHH